LVERAPQGTGWLRYFCLYRFHGLWLDPNFTRTRFKPADVGYPANDGRFNYHLALVEA